MGERCEDTALRAVCQYYGQNQADEGILLERSLPNMIALTHGQELNEGDHEGENGKGEADSNQCL